MVERITSRRSTLRTLPALREEALPRPRAQRMCCGVHTESSADRSEMGKIDRSRRRRGCAGALRHKICTASLDNRPLIDGFVLALFASSPVPSHRIHSFGEGLLTPPFGRQVTTWRAVVSPLGINFTGSSSPTPRRRSEIGFVCQGRFRIYSF